MDNQATCTVEFFGGPFDGHLERYPAERDLPVNLFRLVSENVFRELEGRMRRTLGRITSVAVYRLGIEDGQRRYEFVRALSTKEMGKRWSVGETWLGNLVRSLFRRDATQDQ